jgi:hypothetical protein
LGFGIPARSGSSRENPNPRPARSSHSLFLIPFGRITRNSKIIHTVNQENVKRKTGKWTISATITKRLDVANRQEAARSIRPGGKITA